MGSCGMPGSLGPQARRRVAVVKPCPGGSCGGGLAGCDQRVREQPSLGLPAGWGLQPAQGW